MIGSSYNEQGSSWWEEALSIQWSDGLSKPVRARSGGHSWLRAELMMDTCSSPPDKKDMVLAEIVECFVDG